jgi:hypothetical protein
MTPHIADIAAGSIVAVANAAVGRRATARVSRNSSTTGRPSASEAPASRIDPDRR